LWIYILNILDKQRKIEDNTIMKFYYKKVYGLGFAADINTIVDDVNYDRIHTRVFYKVFLGPLMITGHFPVSKWRVDPLTK